MAWLSPASPQGCAPPFFPVFFMYSSDSFNLLTASCSATSRRPLLQQILHMQIHWLKGGQALPASAKPDGKQALLLHVYLKQWGHR